MIKLNTLLLPIIMMATLLCLPIPFSHAQNEDTFSDQTHCGMCYEACYLVWPNNRKKCTVECERFCSPHQSDLTKSVIMPPEDPCGACMWACKQMQPPLMPQPGDKNCMEECFRNSCSD
jgi:hypothetical protein